MRSLPRLLRGAVIVLAAAVVGPALITTGAGAAPTPAPQQPGRRAASGPAVVLLTGPADRIASRSASFTFDRPTPGVWFATRLDAGRWSAWSRRPFADFAGLRAGRHLVDVRARSASGAVGPVVHAPFSVDLSRPQTVLAGPVADQVRPASAFRFGSDETGSSYTCSMDGGRFGACASPFVATGLAPGGHTFRVRASDAAGNVDASPAVRRFEVSRHARLDGTVPRPTIVSRPSAKVRGSHATIRFAARGAAAYQCRLDEGTPYTCTSPQQLSALTEGRHTFAVRAVGADGGVAPTSAETTWQQQAASTPALLISDNLNRRLLITDYAGKVLWKFDNPTGDASMYSGPLGARWLPNGHILATFGTGKVIEIVPATKTFAWQTAGFGKTWFKSPYDAEILSDGRLAVACARNGSGRIYVYDQKTGKRVWTYRINYPHLVEEIPAGKGTKTTRPTLLMGGFSKVTEAIYAPGVPRNKTVVWRWEHGGYDTHRAILDRDGPSLVISNQDNLVKLARPGQRVVWSRFQGNRHHSAVRGIALLPSGGYAFGYRIWNGASEIRLTDATGNVTSRFSTLSDGTRLNLPWDVRFVSYPG